MLDSSWPWGLPAAARTKGHPEQSVSEKKYKARFLPYLEQLGTVKGEEWGTCYTPTYDPAVGWATKRVRIDCIIAFKPELNMPENAKIMGIEFKKPVVRMVERGDHLAQCWDYRQTFWDNYGGGLPILMCPGFTDMYQYLGIPQAVAESDRRWIAAAGIGELMFHHSQKGIDIRFAEAPLITNNRRTNVNRISFGNSRGSR